MQETGVWSLGQEDPLEEAVAVHSSILACKSHGQRSLAGYSPWGRKELEVTKWLSLPLPSLNIHTFPTFSVNFYHILLKTPNVKIHGKISVEATFNQGQHLNRKVKAICLPAIYVFTSPYPSVLHKIWVRNVSCFIKLKINVIQCLLKYGNLCHIEPWNNSSTWLN